MTQNAMYARMHAQKPSYKVRLDPNLEQACITIPWDVLVKKRAV